jgi:hypothetical protein
MGEYEARVKKYPLIAMGAIRTRHHAEADCLSFSGGVG